MKLTKKEKEELKKELNKILTPIKIEGITYKLVKDSIKVY